jgi:hypothetical protein
MNNNENEANYQYKRSTGSNWLPLLLIPIAFVLGWGVKGMSDQQNNIINNSPGVGSGGGPDNIIMVSPTTELLNPGENPPDNPSTFNQPGTISVTPSFQFENDIVTPTPNP